MRPWLRALILLTAIVAASPATLAQTPPLTMEQVRFILATTRNLAGRNLSGLDLSGLSLAGVDLRSANLSGARLRGVVAERARLSGAILVQAILVEADLRNADLAEADLTRADLTRAKLQKSLLRNARLDEAVLREADLSEVTLNGASLVRANLEKALLTGGSLMNANLGQARLAHAELTNASLLFASLVQADLSHAILRGARLREADVDGADVQDALFADADLSSTRNLDKVRNVDKIRLTAAPSPAPPPVVQQPKLPVVARIVPKNGSPIDVELLVYTREGATYGIPRDNVRRIEDTNGKILREFVERIASAGDPGNRLKDCARPRIGDDASYMDKDVACVRKYGLGATVSQGASTKAAVEQAGRAVTAEFVKRWEIRDGGNVIETYEATGNRITLAEVVKLVK
jgi:uncharacterized protein YjbI with pentapeptide repeats